MRFQPVVEREDAAMNYGVKLKCPSTRKIAFIRCHKQRNLLQKQFDIFMTFSVGDWKMNEVGIDFIVGQNNRDR